MSRPLGTADPIKLPRKSSVTVQVPEGREDFATVLVDVCLADGNDLSDSHKYGLNGVISHYLVHECPQDLSKFAEVNVVGAVDGMVLCKGFIRNPKKFDRSKVGSAWSRIVLSPMNKQVPLKDFPVPK